MEEETGAPSPQCVAECEEQQHSNCSTNSAQPVGISRYAEASGLLTRCTVDWDDVVLEGKFGTIFAGRDIMKGCKVAVLVAEGVATTSHNTVFTHLAETLALLQRQHPGVVELAGKYQANEGKSACVMYMLWLHEVDDMKKFFTSCAMHPKHSDSHSAEDTTEKQFTPEKQHLCEDGKADDSANPKNKTTFSVAIRDDSQQEEQNLHGQSKEQRGGKIWIIGDYSANQEDVIGRGRFGTVYRGWHVVEKYEVAIKVLKGPMDKKDRLVTEARELNRLQKIGHPNIIQLFSTYRKIHRGEIALVHVLELCRGGDLKEFLEKHDPLSESQTRRIMRQLVDCLCVLKNLQVMHRDLKPANILLTSSNIDEAVVKVADWGMAKMSGTNRSGDAYSTIPGNSNSGMMFESAVGTVAYMSPERLQHDFYDFQAEVWAVGVIMYELLFARHPYLHSGSGVRTPDELLNAITRAEKLDMMETTQRSDGMMEKGGLQSLGAASEEQQRGRSLSPECYELMRCMLNADAKKRYTIEQVSVHPWFSLRESIAAREVVKATEVPVETTTGSSTDRVIKVEVASNEKGGVEGEEAGSAEELKTQIKAETSSTEKGMRTSVNTGIVRPFPSTEDEAETNAIHGRGSSLWGFSQRHHTVYQAIREYLHVLRYDVIEEEIDPGRGLVLLAYAWEILRAAVKAALPEENPAADPTTGCDSSTCMPFGTWNSFRCVIPDDLRQIEIYIQETAERLKRNLPSMTAAHPLGETVLAISTASMGGMDTSGNSSTLPSPRFSKTTYPTAQTLLFQRAVSLIRAAATEELMFSCDDERDSCMEEEAAQQQNERNHRQRTYERAMVILRLLLQQVVVQRPFQTNSVLATGTADTAEDSSSLQVLAVPLVPPIEEVDQRTVQALLHKVEKYYRRFVNVR